MTERRISRTAKGKRPIYFSDPATDKLMAIVLSLVGELSVTRDRLDACERLLQERGVLSLKDIDQFTPDAQAQSERASARADYIQRVMRVVTMELQRPDEDGATETFSSALKDMLES